MVLSFSFLKCKGHDSHLCFNYDAIKEHVQGHAQNMIHSFHLLYELGQWKIRGNMVSSKRMEFGRLKHTGKCLGNTTAQLYSNYIMFISKLWLITFLYHKLDQCSLSGPLELRMLFQSLCLLSKQTKPGERPLLMWPFPDPSPYSF